jgi:hypothetical protein
MRTVLRRLTVLGVTFALASVFIAQPAQATLSPPATQAKEQCQDVPAGYTPMAGAVEQTGFTWSGALNLHLCIVKGTGGWVWGRSQLALAYNGIHNRFTGQWRISLQGCHPYGVSTLSEAIDSWDGAQHPVYDYAYVSEGRYRFQRIYTNNVTNNYPSYRIVARSAGASVVPNNAWSTFYSLSSTGPNGQATYVSSCMTI